MYFQLDDIRFQGLYGPSAVDYRSAVRLAKVPLLNGSSALIRTGTDLTEYKLDIYLHFSFVNVPVALAALREKMDLGTVCTFLDGTGELLDDVVLMSLEISERQRNTGGELVAAQAQLVLVEYTAIDSNEPERGRAFDDALALSENDITPVRIEQLPGSDGAQLAAAMISTRAEMIATLNSAELVVKAPEANWTAGFAKVATSAKKAVAGARAGLEILNRVQTLAGQVPALADQLQVSVDRAIVMRNAAERGDLNGVSAASEGLLDSAQSAFDFTRPLNRLVILRRL